MSIRTWIDLLNETYENDQEDDHRETLTRTGFWGAQGAGALFYAQDTERFCIAKRSRQVEQPGTWGTWGGAIDKGEDPVDAVVREASEEAGLSSSQIVKIIPIYVFKSNTFRYSNFIVVIPTEFKPQLNWETETFAWVKYGEWPQPLHFGMDAILNDAASIKVMTSL